MLNVWEGGASFTPPSAPVGAVAAYPTDGNPATAVQPTVPGAYWFHQVTMELVNAIKAGGLTPSATDVTQLSQIISRLTPCLYPDTGATNHLRIQAAIDALSAAGGGVLQLAPGNWDLTGVVTNTIIAPVTIRLMTGCVLSRKTPGGVFATTLGTTAARLQFDGCGIISADFGAASTAPAVSINSPATGSSGARGLVISGVIWIRYGTGTWTYGVETNSIQDMDLAGLLISGEGEPGNAMSGLHLMATNGASVSHSIRGLDCYNVLYGIVADTTASPGIEGLKLVDCDFVGVKHGLLYQNTSGYSPPQVEMVSCHVNSWDTCVKVTKALQVSIIGGLYYRYSRSGVSVYSEGSFFEIDGVQSFSLDGGTSMSTIMTGVDVYGISISAASQMAAFIRLDGFHFWANGRTSPVIRLSGSVTKFVLGGTCVKDTNGKWVDLSLLTSSKKEITLSKDLYVNAADYANTVLTDCAYSAGVLDISGALWGNINLTGAVSGNVITSITGGIPGRTYHIKSDLAGIVIQHNSTCNLRDTTDMTFGAGDTITLYQEAFTLREHARRAA